MFDSKISAHLENNALSSRERTNHRHWPSEASLIRDDGSIVGKCLREQYFQRKGYPSNKTIAARIVRIWDIGKAIEQNEISYAKAIGIWVDDDVAFKIDLEDIVVSGRLDAIYKDDDGSEVCVEYKTSDGWMFDKEVYGKKTRLKGQPKPEHVLQIMLYLEALKHIPYGIIFYLNRSKMETIEHRVELDNGTAIVNGDRTDLTIDKIYARYREFSEYLENDIIPPCDMSPQYSPTDDIEELLSNGSVSTYDYDTWISDDILPGHWKCKSWCAYRDECIKSIPKEVSKVSKESRGAIVKF